MVSRMKTVAATAAITASIAVGGALGAATPASAAQYVPTATGVNVWLTHAETVAAARSGLASYLDSSGITQHIGVYVRPDSRYNSTPHRIPGRAGVYVNVRLQKLVAETAAHPTGRIGLFIDTTNPNAVLRVVEYWKN